MLSTGSASTGSRHKPRYYSSLQKGLFAIRFQTKAGGIAFYAHRVAAGPAVDVEELLEQSLDLNEYLSKNSAHVFCIRVCGDSMTGAGIFNNDLLVVDRSIEAVDGKIVVAAVNAELTLKRLKYLDNQRVLVPENPAYDSIVITQDMDLKILGVVIHVIHSLV